MLMMMMMMMLNFMLMNDDDAGVGKTMTGCKLCNGTMGQFSKIFALKLIAAGGEWSHRMFVC